MHQEVVGAVFPHNFLSFVSSKVFRCLVPVSNPAFSISELDTVGKVVHHMFEETVRFIWGRSPPIFESSATAHLKLGDLRMQLAPSVVSVARTLQLGYELPYVSNSQIDYGFILRIKQISAGRPPELVQYVRHANAP
jgi:hypothetical protein